MNVINNDKADHNRMSNFLFKLDRSNIPIVLALILLLCSMLVLMVSSRSVTDVMNQESSTNYVNSYFANNLMSYAYVLLLIGLVWKFILYVKK